MTITPDDKDWTWVLDKRCGECGFDASAADAKNVADQLRDNAADWQRILAVGSADDLRRRPSPDKWSAVEYGCHVRDVFRKYDGRLQLMLTEDDPLFANWDQDATAIEERYAEQDPATVSAQINEAAQSLAHGFDSVEDDEWDRPGRRSDGARFTIDTFARYFIHDPIHHLYDVTGEAYGGDA
ncbi:MAG: DinB family protein [Mycobacteriales bacterium]